MLTAGRREDRRTALRTLIVGYGNVDRGDDGLGYYVVNTLAQRLGRPVVEPYAERPEPLTDDFDVLFGRQLSPEMSELLGEYDRVFFVDAHTGAFEEELRDVEVRAGYVPAPLTHHMMPETLLSLTEVMFGSAPVARLISGHGYAFGFTTELSEQCRIVADQIVEQLFVLTQS